jgi:hypothetical protein
VTDPSILTAQIGNTKQSFRYKKYNQIRSSEISSFCPREYAIGFLTDTAAESFVSFPLQQTFDLGSALHFWYQNYSKVFRDTLYGHWRCTGCKNRRLNDDGSYYFGLRPSVYHNRPCEHCGAGVGATFFDECLFRLTEPYRIVMKMDGILRVDDAYRICDLKSHAKSEGLPNGKDVAQLASYIHFYQYVPEEEKFPVPVDSSTGYLVYISKTFNYRDPILTFPVRPTERMVSTIVDRVSQFTEAAKTGQIPPPFEVCVKKGFAGGRAKDCYMKELCKEKYENGE